MSWDQGWQLFIVCQYANIVCSKFFPHHTREFSHSYQKVRQLIEAAIPFSLSP